MADALVLLPAPVVIILVAIALPPERFGSLETGLLYGVLAGLSTATIVLRAQALTVMGKPFVEAARVAGGGAWHLIRTHVVPHLLPLAVVQMMVAVVGVIVATAFAQYLTNPRDVLGFGTLLYSGLTFQGFLTTTVAWNVLLSAALSITGLCAGFYLVGRGIRQLGDPRSSPHGAGWPRSARAAPPRGLGSRGRRRRGG